jgi:gluconolactonase
MGPPRLLLRTDYYTEGVVVDSDGAIFFSMTEAGTISRLDTAQGTAVVWAHVPAANGHKIQPDGVHVVMSSIGAVLCLDANGCATNVVASKVDGRWLTYPNDVSLDSFRGGYYVTDSGYKSTPKTMPADPQGCVYRVDGDVSVLQVARGLAYANGIALSPDGSRLYVGESVTNRIWSYPVFADGSLGERSLFVEIPVQPGATTVPDGMTFGRDGRLYVAHYGAREVLVYELDGALAARLEAGNRTISHVAFAADGRTMYVSGGIESESGPGAIFAIDVNA